MKSIVSIPFIIVCIAAAGCATKRVSVSPYVDSSQRGVLYALPKTLLRITVPYTITEETERKHGIDVDTESTVDILKPITLEPVLTADPSQVYVATVDAGSDPAFLESNLSFNLNDDGLLTGVVGDLKDKSLDAVSAAVSAGVQIAKVAAVAGGRPSLPEALRGIEKRMAHLYAALGELPHEAGPDAVQRINAIQGEIALLRSMAADYQSANGKQVHQWQVAYTIVVDPMDLEQDASRRLLTLNNITPEMLVPGIPQDEMPSVTLALHLPRGVDMAEAAVPVSQTRGGILYRLPVPIECRVYVNGSLALRDIIRMPQWGPIGCAPVESKIWADRKSSLAFSGETGGLAAYTVVAGSSAEKAMKALEEVGRTVETELGEIRYDVKMAQLKKEAALLQEIRALHAAKDALEESVQAD